MRAGAAWMANSASVRASPAGTPPPHGWTRRGYLTDLVDNWRGSRYLRTMSETTVVPARSSSRVPHRWLDFPNPVNEVAAGVVATGVVLECVAFLLVRLGAVLVVLAFGFVARVLAGPRVSPLALLATRVVVPVCLRDH